MVTTGVQRGFGTAPRVWLEHNLHQRWRAFLAGVGMTALLQNSTATSLMATAFTANGLMGLGPALVVMLGANVGTTLVTQILSFDAALVGPPLILVGVLAFRWFQGDPGKPIYLKPAARGAATVALANAAREALRIGDMVEAMLRGAVEVFGQDDRQRAAAISRMDRSVDRPGGAIRGYLADLGNAQPLKDENDGAPVQEILSAVINLEHVGDIVTNSLLEFAVNALVPSEPWRCQMAQRSRRWN